MQIHYYFWESNSKAYPTRGRWVAALSFTYTEEGAEQKMNPISDSQYSTVVKTEGFGGILAQVQIPPLTFLNLVPLGKSLSLLTVSLLVKWKKQYKPLRD